MNFEQIYLTEFLHLDVENCENDTCSNISSWCLVCSVLTAEEET